MLKEELFHVSSTVVGDGNTAAAVGSGDMEVFATPAMIALMEKAAMMAVKDRLEAGMSTVGTQLNVSHTRATPRGRRVEATATLAAVDGRKLTFNVEARDENGTVGKGTHERFVVDKDRFLAKLDR